VSREDVQIRVQPQRLTVIGQRRVPWTQQPRSIASCDVPLGEFARSFLLGAGVTPDHVSARLDAGLLTVRIHSGTRAEPSQISITS
jgi:HSP20 family molecular chaperone IbpA